MDTVFNLFKTSIADGNCYAPFILILATKNKQCVNEIVCSVDETPFHIRLKRLGDSEGQYNTPVDVETSTCHVFLDP